MNVAGVNIDSSIAQFGLVRFPIVNIASYRTAVYTKSETTILRILSYCIVALGFLTSITIGRDLLEGGGLVIFFVVFFALYSAINYLPMRKIYVYSLFLNSAGAEQHVFSTHSIDEMNEVESVLRNAISSAGHVIHLSEQWNAGA